MSVKNRTKKKDEKMTERSEKNGRELVVSKVWKIMHVFRDGKGSGNMKRGRTILSPAACLE